MVASLRALVENRGERQIGLYGRAGSGKTHLLNAAAHLARQRGTSLQLYDASDLVELEADAFEGYDRCEVLALDNLDRVAGHPGWEAVVYRLINRCRDGSNYRDTTKRRYAISCAGARACLDWSCRPRCFPTC